MQMLQCFLLLTAAGFTVLDRMLGQSMQSAGWNAALWVLKIGGALELVMLTAGTAGFAKDFLAAHRAVLREVAQRAVQEGVENRE
ncbi:hypothetical protein [Kitasatospora griseola]|uniref:hypothetical protein n=1 Tax=Kitasatospora griseola TaxID=2064 RepID=UPI0034184A53